METYFRKSNDTQLVAESDHLLSTPHDTVFDRSKFEVKTWPRLKYKIGYGFHHCNKFEIEL